MRETWRFLIRRKSEKWRHSGGWNDRDADPRLLQWNDGFFDLSQRGDEVYDVIG